MTAPQTGMPEGLSEGSPHRAGAASCGEDGDSGRGVGSRETVPDWGSHWSFGEGTLPGPASLLWSFRAKPRALGGPEGGEGGSGRRCSLPQ